MKKEDRRLILFSVLALLLGVGMVLGVLLSRVLSAASAVQSDLDRMESLAASGVENVEVEEAVELLHTTRADIQTLQRSARPFLWVAPYLGWVPRYGPDIEAAPALLRIALHLTAAGEGVIEPLSPLLESATDPADADQAELLGEATAALAEAQPQLAQAEAAVEEARAELAGLEPEELSPRVRGWVDKLDRYLPYLEQGIKGALIAPELLGAEGPRTYLVLVQNEDELRATGGFISGVAQVTVENGRIQALSFKDSYAVDDLSHPYPEPPAPIRQYMLTELWLFRDSNWSPDFPTSARRAIELYTLTHDVDVDGVIALNQQAIQLLVGAMAPLQVEGHPEPITAQNAIEVAQQAWEPDEEASGDWWAHRKDFMAALLNAAVQRMEGGLERDQLLRLASSTMQAMEEKSLLLYLEDESAATRVAELGWDSALTPGTGDYLMVVDTNMGFNKVNALVEERLEYQVDLTDPARPRATLTVRHSHPLEGWEGPCNQEPRYDSTYEQMGERCYWDYLRVYVPTGTSLQDATAHAVPGQALLSGQDDPAEVTVASTEHSLDVFGTFFLLRPGEELQTQFEYALPREILHSQGDRHEYTLLVQKQPGTNAVPLDVSIALPPGVTLEDAAPTPIATTTAGVEYALTLETDRTLRVVFRASP